MPTSNRHRPPWYRNNEKRRAARGLDPRKRRRSLEFDDGTAAAQDVKSSYLEQRLAVALAKVRAEDLTIYLYGRAEALAKAGSVAAFLLSGYRRQHAEQAIIALETVSCDPILARKRGQSALAAKAGAQPELIGEINSRKAAAREAMRRLDAGDVSPRLVEIIEGDRLTVGSSAAAIREMLMAIDDVLIQARLATSLVAV